VVGPESGRSEAGRSGAGVRTARWRNPATKIGERRFARRDFLGE